MTGGCYQAPELAWGPDRRCRSGPLPRYPAGSEFQRLAPGLWL